MPVSFHTKEGNFQPLQKTLLKEWFKNIIVDEGGFPGDISVVFTNDEDLLKINQQYLDHDFYTDIITFDYVEGTTISGDIFISIDRVKENAGKFGSGFNEELKRVMVHGILHLLGYKDASPDEKEVMRKKENDALLRVKDLLIV